MANVQNKLNKKNTILAITLVIYIYVPYIANILENALKMSSLYSYVIYLILAIIPLVITMKINKKVLVFLFIFLISIMINYIIVPYKYYVIIEGLQALITLTVPCLCISNSYFNLKTFILEWFKFSKFNLPLVLISCLLLKLNLVHYSIFTSICVPNVFICSFMILQGNQKDRLIYLNILINILVILIFGGRMAALISICMFLFSYIYSTKTHLWKKTTLIIVLITMSYIILTNITSILYWVSKVMDQLGMESRSVTLLIDQIKNNEIYLTNRDFIYLACIEYIRSRMGFPGGFGIPLYITSGEYYYTHNVILQFFTFFGVWGTIIVIGILYMRSRVIKCMLSPECRKFIYFMLICYLGVGMTGSSIWIHYLSTIFIALFFFGNKKIYRTIGMS